MAIVVSLNSRDPQPGLTSVVWPLEMPLYPGPSSVVFRQGSIVAIVESAYTKQQQTQEWQGEWWEADISLPPMPVQQARAWCAFMAACRGRAGYFLLGENSHKFPQGVGGSFVVNGASQTGRTLAVTSSTLEGIALRSGDYIQIGFYAGTWATATDYGVGYSVWRSGAAYWCKQAHTSGATTAPGTGVSWASYWTLTDGIRQRLHMNLTDATTDVDGNVTLDLWPALRESPPDGAGIIVNEPRGIFRLKDNMRQWSADAARIYGMSFSAAEVI